MQAEFAPRPTRSTPSVPSISHPYTNDPSCTTAECGLLWSSGNLTVTGAERVRVYFARFATQKDYDVGRIYNGAGTQVQEYTGLLADGTDEGFWSGWVSGTTIKAELWGNNTGNAYGFEITRLEADLGDEHVVNIGFPGQYHDAESGLVYNGARYYEPRLGRYLQTDPAADPSQYAYAALSPAQATDPTGRSPVPDVTFFFTRGGFVALSGIVGTANGASAALRNVSRFLSINNVRFRLAQVAGFARRNPSALWIDASANGMTSLGVGRVPNPGFDPIGRPFGNLTVDVILSGPECAFLGGVGVRSFCHGPMCALGRIAVCGDNFNVAGSPGVPGQVGGAQGCAYLREVGHSCGISSMSDTGTRLAQDFAGAFVPGPEVSGATRAASGVSGCYGPTPSEQGLLRFGLPPLTVDSVSGGGP